MKYATWFGINNFKKASTEEDKILIKVLRQEHGYGAKRFLKEFSNKDWCLSSVIKLLKKIDETGIRIRDIDHLRARLVEEWQLLDHVIIDRAIKQWRLRLRSCVRERG